MDKYIVHAIGIAAYQVTRAGLEGYMTIVSGDRGNASPVVPLSAVGGYGDTLCLSCLLVVDENIRAVICIAAYQVIRRRWENLWHINH